VDYYSHKHTNSSHQPPLLNIVKTYPADKFNLLNTNTEFSIEAEESSSDALIIQASSDPPFDSFTILKAFLVLNVGEYYCQYSLIL
jgi:hypothetical protein